MRRRPPSRPWGSSQRCRVSLGVGEQGLPGLTTELREVEIGHILDELEVPVCHRKVRVIDQSDEHETAARLTGHARCAPRVIGSYQGER